MEPSKVDANVVIEYYKQEVARLVHDKMILQAQLNEAIKNKK